MFDDLRPKGSVFDEEEQAQDGDAAKSAADAPTMIARAPTHSARAAGGPEIRILGMTAVQRLVIAILVFFDVAVLGFFLIFALSPH